MTEQRKIKFLTVIWGARYVEEFIRVSLPSYLAPGNLPHIAAETDLEILVMTSAASVPVFEEQPLFRRLRALCPVRFILIDDLIASAVYGVTLTLAYARGIQDSGAEQTRTHFVFMNADFVLADGSLATLLEALRAGQRCIMAPSLRATSETTLPWLAEAVGPDGTIVMTPRQMVRLTFDNLHPTVVGKTVTQGLFTSCSHTQVYWQVDENTLLARHYLIFMLAITPEVPLGVINSYSDYGFVPEMVPSGEFSVLGDSDDFFMLELGPRAQEKGLIKLGSSTLPQIAQELSAWTTAEHRRFAEVDVVFRAADAPPGLDAARLDLSGFMARLKGKLHLPAVSHVGHHYWVGGLQLWVDRRLAPEAPLPPELDIVTINAAALGSDPPEAASAESLVARPDGIPKLSKRSAASLARRLYLDVLSSAKRLSGSAVPKVALWHNLWPDSQLVLQFMRTVPNRVGDRNLLVCESSSLLPAMVRPRPDYEVHVGTKAFIERQDPAPMVPDGGYAHILLHMYRANVLLTGQAISRAEQMLAPDGTIGVFIEHVDADMDYTDFSAELADCLEFILPTDWVGRQMTARFVGGTLKRRLRQIERFAMGLLLPVHRSRVVHIIAGFMIYPMVAALTALHNCQNRKQYGNCPPWCSAAMLVLRRPLASGPDEPAAP